MITSDNQWYSVTSSARLFLCPAIEAIDSQPDCSCAWNQDLTLFPLGLQDYIKGIFALPIVSRQKPMQYPFFLALHFWTLCENFKVVTNPFGEYFWHLVTLVPGNLHLLDCLTNRFATF